MSTAQDYKTHRQYVPGYHYVLSAIVLAVLIGSGINVYKSIGTAGLYSATLISAIAVALVLSGFYLREFALKAQDRAIRAEENLRHYVRSGQLLDSRLEMKQIIALRFASDEEYDELAARAIAERMEEDDIKKAVKNWRPDTYRV